MKTLGQGSLACVLVAGMLAACSQPSAPDWQRITQGDPCAPAAAPAGDDTGAASPACTAPAVYLDVANLEVKGGTPYVILQTRYADGRTGAIRAEANCPRQKLEPTALKETVHGSDGAVLVPMQMTTLSAADETAVLQQACARR